MLFFIILILSLVVSFVMPWWIVAIIAFVAALFIAKSAAHAFLSGFAAIFVVWIVLVLFKSVPNNHILAGRIATMFHLPNWILLLLATALIGGLVAGMAALSGLLVRQSFKKTDKQN